MRLTRATQVSVFEPAPVDHPLCGELESISKWLDAHPELLDEVVADLGAPGRPPRIDPRVDSAPRRAEASARQNVARSWRFGASKKGLDEFLWSRAFQVSFGN